MAIYALFCYSSLVKFRIEKLLLILYDVRMRIKRDNLFVLSLLVYSHAEKQLFL